ncbi:MAG: glycerophosphodiester phosphodiesterase family protein [Ruminiclostridium sp.]
MKKSLKITAAALAAALTAYAVIALLPRQKSYIPENPLLKDGGFPVLVAHGGGNMEFPNDTLEAFYNAYSVDEHMMIETDVSITKDGVLILSHDTTLDRNTNVTGEISDWNYSDLLEQRVDFSYENPVDENFCLNGERVRYKDENGSRKYPTDVSYPEGILPRDEEIFLVTTLEELFTAFPETRINVEIKQGGETGRTALKEALRLTEKYNAFDRVCFASFHEEIYAEYQRMQAAGEAPDTFMCSPATNTTTLFFFLQLLGLDALFPDKIAIFQLPTEAAGFSLSTKAFVDNAHKHNIAVQYWTINDEEEMRRLIEIGADGITTDRPHTLKKVCDEYRNS